MDLQWKEYKTSLGVSVRTGKCYPRGRNFSHGQDWVESHG